MGKYDRSILEGGYQAELEYIGTVDQRKYLKLYGPLETVAFKEGDIKGARQDVRNTQKKAMRMGNKIVPITPQEPERPFADDLFITLAEELDLEDYSNLSFYTAVHSHLDIMGEDAFFDLKIKNNDEPLTVSIDLKGNPFQGKKADITINVPDPKNYIISREEGAKEYWDIIREKAKEIAKEFKNKIN